MDTDTLPPRLAQPLPAGSLEVLRRALRRAPLHLLLIACLSIAWLIVAPRSPDLAAQVYRANLFSRFGMLLWDNNWYGGHHMPGYSLTYPPLASLLGVRAVGVIAVIASTLLFGRIVTLAFGRRTPLASASFAVAAAGDLWIGRLSFALGVSFALASVLLLLEGRNRRGAGTRWAIALAVLCAISSSVSSPVAGLLLAFAGLTDLIANRRLRYAAPLIVPVLLALLPLEVLFPEGGFEPYGLESFLASTAVALGFIWALPREERLLRIGGSLFAIANAISLLPTPMGSNVVRYAVLLAGPLLIAALTRRGRVDAPRARPRWALGVVLIGIAVWVVWGPVVQSTEVLADPSTHASFYAPLRRFLATHAKGPIRIEVPFTRSHWEAALLAPHVSLARGWERQLDKRYDEAIEANPLPAAVYERWLDKEGVSYVALPNVPLDGSSIGEAALIRQGVPFLAQVFSSRYWRVYEVLGSRPLAEGPGSLLSIGHEDFTLRAKAAGTFLVRVHYTPYWSSHAQGVSISETGSDWTRVTVSKPGVVRVEAQFSLHGALKALRML